MNLSNNTVLITGGSTGIGLAMAEQFLNAGSKVIICARKQEKLDEAQQKFPDLILYLCDVQDKSQRELLAQKVISDYPDLNILVNNAGIQRQNNFVKGADIVSAEEEITTNFLAPVHLTALFLPHLLSKTNSAIINNSSGLGLVPIARMPVYCATKAAMHSFTWSLRHQLKDTSIKVFEIIPPIVDTDLDHGTRPPSFRGMHVDDFIKQTMPGIESDTYEIAIGMSKGLVEGMIASSQEAFDRMNG